MRKLLVQTPIWKIRISHDLFLLSENEAGPKETQLKDESVGTLKLHIVGTGCNAPSGHAYGSAFLLEIGDTFLLFDCGPATSYKLASMGLDLKRIHHVFFTHHHYDHTADFPCFALTRWDKSKGDQPPLAVYGPPPTQDFVAALFGSAGAFFADWQARIKSPASLGYYRLAGGALPRPGPVFDVREIAAGPVAETDTWAVSCAPVRHVDPVDGEPLLTSLAYRVETNRGSIVFAGDCDDCPELRSLARRVNTLVVKPRATLPLPFVAGGEPDISSIGRSLTTGSGETLEQDGDLLRECAPQRVVLSHLAPGFFGQPGLRERVLATIGRSYKGLMLMPDELTNLDLTPDVTRVTPIMRSEM